MEINEELIKITTKCQNNFACLNDENHFCLSNVDDCINNKVHFVKCSDNNCSYRLSFGYSFICNCPIRKEIFNKYNI